jgi:SAM-dependent methyltransferase
MNDPSVMREWAGLVKDELAARGKSLVGSRLLEIGPGHSVGVAFNLLAECAKDVYAVDVRPYADLSDFDPELRKRFHYEISNDDAKWSIEPQTIDFAYSFFSGEHLRYPAKVVSAVSRALRPDGACLFLVDLQDHAHREDNWLHFLYYDTWLWNAMYSQRGAWTNRLLEPDWRMVFERFFGDVQIESKAMPLPANFDPSKVAPIFRKYSESVIAIAHIRIVAREPRQGIPTNVV